MKLKQVVSGILTAGSIVFGVAEGAEIISEQFTEQETVVEQHVYNNVHEIVVNDVYRIDGINVDYDTYMAMLEARNVSAEVETDQTVSEITEITEISEITITAGDMDTSGIARLANYIDFEEDDYGNIIAAKVISNKVCSISYDYAEQHESYTQNGVFTGIEYGASVYQDTTKTDGLYITKGMNEGISYEVVYNMNATIGTYVFKFINNPTYADITFAQVFDQITLTLVK